jgi:hypothetical protein
VIRGRRESFNSNDALQHNGSLVIVGGGWHDSGAVDKIDSFGEGDVFPDLAVDENIIDLARRGGLPSSHQEREQQCRLFHSSVC